MKEDIKPKDFTKDEQEAFEKLAQDIEMFFAGITANRQKEQEAAALAQLESDAAQPGGDAAPTEIAADG